jgi:hypothetical protein
MTDAPTLLDMDTMLELLRLRGCLVAAHDFTDGSHWVSYTSIKGRRWAVIESNNTQRALDFLKQLNTEGI